MNRPSLGGSRQHLFIQSGHTNLMKPPLGSSDIKTKGMDVQYVKDEL